MCKKRWKINWKLIIRLSGVILLVIILARVDYHELWQALRKVNVLLYLLSILAIIPIYIFKSIRWKYLLSLSNIQYPFRDAFLAFFAANFVAFLTPGRLGEVVKAFYVKADKHVPLVSAIPSVVFDRLFDVYFLLIIAFAGFFRFDLLNNAISYGLISIILILIPFIVLNRRLVMPVIGWIMRPGIFRKLRESTLHFFIQFYDRIGEMLDFRLLIGVFWTVVAYLFLFLSTWFIALSMELPTGFFTVAVMIATVNALSFLPITIGGLGVREITLIYFFGFLNLSPESAIAFSTLFFCTFYIAGGLFGFICYHIKGESLLSRNKVVEDIKG
jgi:uncharacterized protein (TIRG00374 family)